MTKAALLVAWLAQAILTWTPGVRHDEVRAAEADGLARELLAVAFRVDEAPAYKGPDGRARTALLVAAIGSQESAFIRRIQLGDCRCRREVCECDGQVIMGRPYFAAACYLQIHANDRGGIALVGDGWVYGDYLKPRSEAADQARVYRNEDLLGDPTNCFLVGQHMARASILHMGGRLCGYTGEEGPCPKADWRQGLADAWFRAHPPPAADTDVLP